MSLNARLQACHFIKSHGQTLTQVLQRLLLAKARCITIFLIIAENNK